MAAADKTAIIHRSRNRAKDAKNKEKKPDLLQG
jgi:hypothetical protein